MSDDYPTRNPFNDMYFRLRYRMFKAVARNIFGLSESEPAFSQEAIRLWNFLFPEDQIIKKDRR